MAAMVVMTFILIAISGSYPLFLKKYWKELIVFNILLFIGFAFTLLLVLGVDLPYAGDVIWQFFDSILGKKS